LFTADCLFAGEPEPNEYLEAVCTELAEKADAGKGISYPERFRILSIGIPPILLQGAVEKTCRQSAPMIKLIKEALNSIDISILILDCYIVDVTVTPEEDLCQKLRQFFELLEDR
jgi:hypothetical protein